MHGFSLPTQQFSVMTERLQKSVFAGTNFGEIIFALRQMRGLSQRQLAKLAHIPPSSLSEIETNRRAPPPIARVKEIGAALRLLENEQIQLIGLAERERNRLGTKVKKNTPRHVADLIREIAGVADQLSQANVQTIREKVSETVMK